jgi:sodium/proline symporter
MNHALIAFLVYLFGMVLAGTIAARFTRTLEDFGLGGRKLGSWVIALSEKSTDMSTWLLVGLPGQAFRIGFGTIWALIGVFFGSLANWVVIAERLRKFSLRFSAITLPDYFESRFKDRSHTLRVVGMVLIVFFFTLYVSAQCVGAGKILSATFTLSKVQGMAIALGFIIFYTMAGGFLAEAWTDFFQALIMMVGLSLLSIVGIAKLGGLGELIRAVGNVSPKALTWGGGATGLAMFGGVVIGGLAIGLGYAGQPHIVTRYMALSKKSKMSSAAWIAMVWTLIVLVGAVMVGIVGIATLGTLDDPETVTTSLAAAILPPWLVGIIIAAATAAMMSTVDSQLLIAATSVAEDFWKNLINRKASQQRLLFVGRMATVAIGIVAFLLGIKAERAVYWLVLYAWGGLAASFGPPLILSLRWRRTTKWGVLAGMIVGAVTIVVWYNVPFLKNALYELVPGFFFSLIAVIVVSLLGPKPSKELEEEFGEVARMTTAEAAGP